ncbi:DEAD/DEAH box helicase family protein, partial [Candidatus Bathyarchaeota archaeon]|nr:DEAD/DEAH box helicase family protein [Candidatus Bathyarchaeota archaeon]
MIRLFYDHGSIVIKGGPGTPYGKWDPRINAYRGLALYYAEVKSYLEKSGLSYSDEVLDLPPMPKLVGSLKLRSYQEEALNAWLDAGKRGVIVLPTGAGKTHVALQAIQALTEPTLIMVPTIDLLDQWRRNLEKQFNIEAGALGGGEDQIRAVTVSTYDSAALRAGHLGNRFMFLVFDEVHHLPAPTYSQIAEMYAAPHRMGLTATYEREDGAQEDLPRLMGGKIYELKVDQLAGKHLSNYDYEKVLVELTSQEQEDYDREYAAFREY